MTCSPHAHQGCTCRVCAEHHLAERFTGTPGYGWADTHQCALQEHQFGRAWPAEGGGTARTCHRCGLIRIETKEGNEHV